MKSVSPLKIVSALLLFVSTLTTYANEEIVFQAQFPEEGLSYTLEQTQDLLGGKNEDPFYEALERTQERAARRLERLDSICNEEEMETITFFYLFTITKGVATPTVTTQVPGLADFEEVHLAFQEAYFRVRHHTKELIAKRNQIRFKIGVRIRAGSISAEQCLKRNSTADIQ